MLFVSKKSIWRSHTDKFLEKLIDRLDFHDCIDLGGDRSSHYANILAKKNINYTCLNLSTNHPDDLQGDLEKPLNIADSSYDLVLSINVMEHIYDYKNLISESWRILKGNGTLIYVVPFLIRVHPHPNDYFRFTYQSIHRLFKDLPNSNLNISIIGSGAFTASYSLVRNILIKLPIIEPLIRYVAIYLDMAIYYLGIKTLGKDNFPLGYIIEIKKNVKS